MSLPNEAVSIVFFYYLSKIPTNSTISKPILVFPNSFEEMRIRYERREPRPEDVREIHELKSIVDAQDKDLRNLTEKLRSMQMHRNCDDKNQKAIDREQTIDETNTEPMVQMVPAPIISRKMKKPIINCDVIYEEENEG